MMLQIDVGNTQTKWRVIDGEFVCSRGSQDTASLIESELDLSAVAAITEARLSSVADSRVAQAIKNQLATQFNIELQVATVSASAGGVSCGYEDVRALGVDRWLALVAAYKLYQGAVLVVDVGSAMTLDLVSPDGQHVGGYILPGLRLMREALLRGTEKVKSDLTVESIDTINMLVPGAVTEDAVNRGCLLAAVATVEKLASTYPAAVVITGGDALPLIEALSLKTDHKPDLVLAGLGTVGVTLEPA
ncbi:type III pantothenate kinase [Porticoccaceae bacterium]|nr:type III pantothenate kinase [Porticoccaceae bacterium]